MKNKENKKVYLDQTNDDFLMSAPFVDERKKSEYDVLVPLMMEPHLRFLISALESMGYNLVPLEETNPEILQEGLKFIHNDSCYPLTCVASQIISKLKTMTDTSRVAIALTQTGGGCRATNYIPLMRKALIAAGFKDIPFLIIHLGNPFLSKGVKIDLSFFKKVISAVCYGDLLMHLRNSTRTYEVNHGDADKLMKKWMIEISKQYKSRKGSSGGDIKRNMKAMVTDYQNLPIVQTDAPKVGIVGEIYVKYSPLGNNSLEEFLVNERCEIRVPGLLAFILFCLQNQLYDQKYYGGRGKILLIIKPILWYFLSKEKALNRALKDSKFQPIPPFKETMTYCRGIIKHGAKMGEGWLLAAEIVELIHEDYPNIVCAQPFGCLPNHILGKGVIKRVRQFHPKANIVPIDYDASVSRVNQENRLRLMLAIARENKATN